MANFRPIDRDTGFLMPPSVNEWLPAQHLHGSLWKWLRGWTCGRSSGATWERVLPRITRACCWPSFVRLRDGGVFEPQAGTCDL